LGMVVRSGVEILSRHFICKAAKARRGRNRASDRKWLATLIVEGLTMAGTQAATDILFSREEMRPVLEKAAVGNGKLKPFDLLIETRSFGSSSP
jgi:hypothetical protein